MARITGLTSSVHDALPRRRARCAPGGRTSDPISTAARSLSPSVMACCRLSLPCRRARSRRVADGDIEAPSPPGRPGRGDRHRDDRGGQGPAATPRPRSAPGSASAAKPHNSARANLDPAAWLRRPIVSVPVTCPIRWSMPGLTATRGQSDILAHVRHGSPTRCARRPPKQEIISRRHLPAGTVPPSPRCHHSP